MTEALAARALIGDESALVAEAAPALAASSNPLADDRLVKIYIKIRDAKAVLKKRMDEEVGALDAQLKQISTELLHRMQDRHNDGIRTEMGTVYIAETLKTSCADWGVFYDWIKTTDNLDFLEQRIKAGSVKEYMAKNEGALPPGVNVFREYEARVRKPVASKA